MLESAKQIIEEFEANDPVACTKDHWLSQAEEIALYLAALKYVELHG